MAYTIKRDENELIKQQSGGGSLPTAGGSTASTQMGQVSPASNVTWANQPSNQNSLQTAAPTGASMMISATPTSGADNASITTPNSLQSYLDQGKTEAQWYAETGQQSVADSAGGATNAAINSNLVANPNAPGFTPSGATQTYGQSLNRSTQAVQPNDFQAFVDNFDDILAANSNMASEWNTLVSENASLPTDPNEIVRQTVLSSSIFDDGYWDQPHMIANPDGSMRYMTAQEQAQAKDAEVQKFYNSPDLLAQAQRVAEANARANESALPVIKQQLWDSFSSLRNKPFQVWIDP